MSSFVSQVSSAEFLEFVKKNIIVLYEDDYEVQGPLKIRKGYIRVFFGDRRFFGSLSRKKITPFFVDFYDFEYEIERPSLMYFPAYNYSWRKFMAQKFGAEYVNALEKHISEYKEDKIKALYEEFAKYDAEIKEFRENVSVNESQN